MNGAETVEQLTDIIVRQAIVINELYAVVQQLNAATSLDADIRALQAEARAVTGSPEQPLSGLL